LLEDTRKSVLSVEIIAALVERRFALFEENNCALHLERSELILVR